MTLDTLKRVRHAFTVISRQQTEIAELRELAEVQNELLLRAAGLIDWLQLESARDKHQMLCAWMISLEQPENTDRDELAAAENRIAHEIAQREEHVL